jgi:hypothetical protein
MDAVTRALLEAILRREGRSLLQYVSESFPWTNPDEQAALAQLQELVQEERKATGALLQLFARREHTVPYLGSFPESFTTINFVSLDHLLPLLVDAERQGLEQLQSDLAKLTDPQLRDQVSKMVEMKRRHLATLKTLITSPSAATSPV